MKIAKSLKRAVAAIMVLAMCLSLLPAIAFATPATAGTTATLVTDVSTLAAGDQVVIVAKDYAKALSTTQNGNNRGTADITKNGNQVTLTDTVEILTLEAGTVENTYAFSTGSGYLYSASSSKNYLRTQTTNDANSSWTIEIDASTGVATVKSQGTYTHNWMQYNASSTIFASYSSAQKDLCIY